MLHPLTHCNTAQIHVCGWPNQNNLLVINPATAEARMKFSLIHGCSMDVGQRLYHHEAEIVARAAVLCSGVAQTRYQRDIINLQVESLSDG